MDPFHRAFSARLRTFRSLSDAGQLDSLLAPPPLELVDRARLFMTGKASSRMGDRALARLAAALGVSSIEPEQEPERLADELLFYASRDKARWNLLECWWFQRSQEEVDKVRVRLTGEPTLRCPRPGSLRGRRRKPKAGRLTLVKRDGLTKAERNKKKMSLLEAQPWVLDKCSLHEATEGDAIEWSDTDTVLLDPRIDTGYGTVASATGTTLARVLRLVTRGPHLAPECAVFGRVARQCDLKWSFAALDVRLDLLLQASRSTPLLAYPVGLVWNVLLRDVLAVLGVADLVCLVLEFVPPTQYAADCVDERRCALDGALGTPDYLAHLRAREERPTQSSLPSGPGAGSKRKLTTHPPTVAKKRKPAQ